MKLRCCVSDVLNWPSQQVLLVQGVAPRLPQHPLVDAPTLSEPFQTAANAGKRRTRRETVNLLGSELHRRPAECEQHRCICVGADGSKRVLELHSVNFDTRVPFLKQLRQN